MDNVDINGYTGDLIIFDEANEITEYAWKQIIGIVAELKMYRYNPCKRLNRYQKQCRFYAGDWKDNYDAKEKSNKEEEQTLGKV